MARPKNLIKIKMKPRRRRRIRASRSSAILAKTTKPTTKRIGSRMATSMCASRSSKCIVFFAFLYVRERLVGLSRRLKSRLRLFVVWVSIGVRFHGYLAVCTFNGIRRGIFWYSKSFIKIRHTLRILYIYYPGKCTILIPLHLPFSSSPPRKVRFRPRSSA